MFTTIVKLSVEIDTIVRPSGYHDFETREICLRPSGYHLAAIRRPCGKFACGPVAAILAAILRPSSQCLRGLLAGKLRAPHNQTRGHPRVHRAAFARPFFPKMQKTLGASGGIALPSCGHRAAMFAQTVQMRKTTSWGIKMACV